ncbi:hypothetical protein LPB67_14675 [Undibacterium sp. Jales W-56]|uniref:PhaM family polyhydroxyalkanoate granule multifunctional regulatory protein n=1 Tax=Undibacterium sp. Jales W-56 TaxID=2897325 RepID=UPI0021D20371|nr:PhaM family polyhydroxyalkanoate granule multifunctional regulatory protein [Undibacterium sp. Jales W-56]MCU6435019.1 hypothetical protein [Undibacterium sp. Jales W-56]
MTSPFQGNDFPGMNAMNDTLSFVKNIWGGMHVPGMVTPTVSVDELDKKIKDLKTVESWLTVNMNMLRGTIQALEVQRATIAALNSLGESFASTMANATADKPDQSAQAEKSAKPFEFAKHDFWPNATATPEAKKEPVPEPVAEPIAEPVSATTTAPEVAASAGTAKAQPAENNSAFSNPAAWWNLLQDQFKQAVSHAMIDEAAVSTSVKQDKPVKKTVTKGSASTAKTSSAANKKISATGKKTLSPVTKKTASRKPAVVSKAHVVSGKKSTAGGK